MKYYLWVLTIAVLVIAACEPVTKEPATREPTAEVVMVTVVIERTICLTAVLINEESWIDWNGDGNRDPEDEPLQNVRFRVEWEKQGQSTGPTLKTFALTSDATGHAFLTVKGPCAEDRVESEPDTPQGYTLTSREFGRCKFEYPAGTPNPGKGVPCDSYGFTPTTP